jgi:hypothetical protein
MMNCNPETVSTDYDTSSRLYFEPITGALNCGNCCSVDTGTESPPSRGNLQEAVRCMRIVTFSLQEASCLTLVTY